MCFSATASFSVGMILIATSIYTLTTAQKYNRHYLLLALIPFLFGMQQCIEGLIWLNLDKGEVTRDLGQLYLFFAFFLWPGFIPFSIYQVETNPTRKKIIGYFSIGGVMLGLFLYVPILAGLTPLAVSAVQHSINYQVYQSDLMLRTYATLGYAFISIFPLFLASQPKIRVLGVLTVLSFLATYWWLVHAFTSIWCFFVAVLSLYIAYLVRSTVPLSEESGSVFLTSK